MPKSRSKAKVPLSEVSVGEYETIQFDSLDGLRVTADYYKNSNPKGVLLLCHRSHFNRGEYRETAPKFVELGYSCLAIDQRSGMNVLGVTNETSSLAKEKKLPTGYLDAQPDVEAAIDFASSLNNGKPITFVGSSYTGSLGLLLAQDNDRIKTLLTFSPAECLKKVDLASAMETLTKPTYVTSTKAETADTTELFRNVDPQYVTHYKPTLEGFHGSRILWESVDGYEQAWSSVEGFLTANP